MAIKNLSEIINSGQFSLFLEGNLIADRLGPEHDFREIKNVAQLAQRDDRIAGLALVAEGPIAAPLDIIGAITAVATHCSKEILAYLSGRELSQSRITEALSQWHQAGIKSVAMVSGNAEISAPAHRGRTRTPRKIPHLDSCRMLTLAGKHVPDLFLAATVNPFKYVINDTMLQYLKMIRKLNSGAQLLVAQAGWDMKKYQELQWFLRNRDRDDAVFARVIFLHPNELNAILENKRSGILISHQLADLLKKEMSLNLTQSLTTQLQRVALQAVGCKFLGYSGIQLGGLPDIRTAELVVQKISETLAEYHSYNDWLAAWNDFHDHCEMAPMPYHYYMYNRLMEKDLAACDTSVPLAINGHLPELELKPKLEYLCGEMIALKRNRIFKKCWRRYGLRKEDERLWNFAATQAWTARQCPKGLTDGACGGSMVDGRCEYGHRTCAFHRILALANWQHRVYEFENP